MDSVEGLQQPSTRNRWKPSEDVTRQSRFPIGAGITLDQLETGPHPHLARLRADEPVSWVPVFDGWMVTGRDEAIEAMRDWETYTVDDPRFSTGQVVGPSMLSLDGPEHTRHRKPFVDPFRADPVRERLKQSIIARARNLIDGFKTAGHAELGSQLSGPLAVGVMSDLLGLEGVDPDSLLDWYDDIVAAVDAVTAGEDVPAAGVAAYQALKDAVESAMAGEALPLLIRRQGDLNTDEIVSNIAILLFGGIVTTEGTTSTLLHQLMLNPDQLEQVRQDRSLIRNAVEETLRYEPAAAAIDRYATRDTRLGDVLIEAGDLVRISLAAPNRDPEVFSDPDRFDITRANAGQHLGFARGPHACLGIHLARMETAIAVEIILDELPTMRLDPEMTLGASGLIFRGPRAVAARWTQTG